MRKSPRLALTGALALLSALHMGTSGTWALPGGTADGADRYPFVVAIKADDRLICSGTVLYPRLVVTAAHCLQQVVAWRMRFYVEDYLPADALSVSVVQGGEARSYTVVEAVISPGWLASGGGQPSGARLPHDLALLVTAAPIDVGLPPSLLTADASPVPRSPAGPAQQRGVLVAFGGAHCLATDQCEDAGVRRFLRVSMKDGMTCFKSRRDRDAGLPFTVWCVESRVLPGDSGGALLVEAPDGALHYAGVISAQQGPPQGLGVVTGWQQSAAASLESNLDFILERARALGYAPVSSDP